MHDIKPEFFSPSLTKIKSSLETRAILDKLSTDSIIIIMDIRTFKSEIGEFADKIQKFLKDAATTLPPRPIMPNPNLPEEELICYRMIRDTLKAIADHPDAEDPIVNQATKLMILITLYAPGLEEVIE